MNTPFPPVEFDAAIITKLSQSGPRYTSYPTADRFQGDFGYSQFLEAVAGLRMRRSRRPLSLYIHIPFCDTVCYYCGCNKIVTKDHSKAAVYLGYLKQEIDMQGRLFDGMGQIEQLHFGGGTPTYLSDRQMGDLMAHLHANFDFADDAHGEYSIEIDPRTVSVERVHSLRAQGFNRISLGVQDFDPDVQKAVNRIQPEAETRAVMDAARAAGYRSISIDLIYGLPKQTMASMTQTLDKVIDASPDRIALYNYAHLPHIFKPQRRIADADMPTPAVKLELLAMCIQRLCDAGYIYIGMDHFAKPDDELAVAQRQGRLQRNFQGYSTRAESELISCGVSAISAVGATYSQNEKTLDAYYAKLDDGVLPITRGIKMDNDDLLRRMVIGKLMCNFELSLSSIEQGFPIKFRQYFAAELQKLKAFEDDGLLTVDDEWISVTPKGRLLIRNICMVFDRYLGVAQDIAPQPLRYSKTI
ncbi:oxygen-independent coproporphyrinogen III oxidase [Duganella dendranthematis]|jgi:oxygen-independent coproporphyrinogen-3 oxidase|uniref:Coproporphyrinogen-III oxidase n=1 Tax=Duganella dendranthematis TaxID=2728021 RepID=A0ABX6M8A1_9BURK|nr:oxygen-independent coproporphyrinogen III oxidase [Duganella dendranthematis]QJD90539.1 oxygen-independent coproporphyrinogen III oxidase [Duganella dendranthematis]